jgi:hypothetical protein
MGDRKGHVVWMRMSTLKCYLSYLLFGQHFINLPNLEPLG